MAAAVADDAAVIPDPPSKEAWLALAGEIFPDWHAQGLAMYHGAGWTLQALVDYRCVRACVACVRALRACVRACVGVR